MVFRFFFFFSSRRRHTRSLRDWSSDVCSSDLECAPVRPGRRGGGRRGPECGDSPRDGGVDYAGGRKGDLRPRGRVGVGGGAADVSGGGGRFWEGGYTF